MKLNFDLPMANVRLFLQCDLNIGPQTVPIISELVQNNRDNYTLYLTSGIILQFNKRISDLRYDTLTSLRKISDSIFETVIFLFL